MLTVGQILKHIVLQRWLSLRRSESFKLQIAARIGKGVAVLYLLGVFFYAGYMLDVFIARIFPKMDSVEIVDRYFMLVLLFMVAIRFFIQKLPAVDMQPYLNLPFRKSPLVRAWLLLSFISWWTFLPVAFLLPFWAKTILQRFAVVAGGYWLIGVGILVLVTNLVVVLLKVLFFEKPLKFISLALLLAIALWADNIFNLHFVAGLSASLFKQLLSLDTMALFSLIFLFSLFFYGTSRLVRNRLYLDTV